MPQLHIQSPPWSGHCLAFQLHLPHRPVLQPLPASRGHRAFYALHMLHFSAWNMLSSFCALKNPIHFSSFNLNVSSCVKSSFILSKPRRSDYTLWSSIPLLIPTSITGLTTTGVQLFIFTSTPWSVSLSSHLLQTLEDPDQNSFVFVSQHRVWPSLMYSSNLLAVIDCWVCLKDSTRHWGWRRERAFPDAPESGVWWA